MEKCNIFKLKFRSSGVTGGLAAPLIGSGLAPILGGTAFLGALTGAAGAATFGTIFGAAGAGLAGLSSFTVNQNIISYLFQWGDISNRVGLVVLLRLGTPNWSAEFMLFNNFWQGTRWTKELVRSKSSPLVSCALTQTMVAMGWPWLRRRNSMSRSPYLDGLKMKSEWYLHQRKGHGIMDTAGYLAHSKVC